MVYLLLLMLLIPGFGSAEKLVIGVNGPNEGLFSNFITVLNFLKYCDTNNHTPVVSWGPKCTYYAPEGYNGSFNAWEYYFEPVSSIPWDPNDPISRGNYGNEVLDGPVIYYPALRSQNGKPLHLGNLKDKAERGEEVLIEMLLLTKCSFLVHSRFSLVPAAVYYFNPEIEGVCF